MTGTWINIATVLFGGGLGLLFGARLPERMRKTVVAGLGLFTAAIGIQMFFETQNAIIVLTSLLVGGLIGEWGRVEDGLRGLGSFLEDRITRQRADRRKISPTNEGTAANHLSSSTIGAESNAQSPEGSRFVRGFLTASLVFCIGPMTILGSIQDGLTGDFNLLAIKSVLDGFAALAFASTLGVGVLFSTLVILSYQGGLSLLAAQAQAIISPAMMAEMTAVGGVLLLGLAVSSLLEIKPIRVGSFLPALFIAPLAVATLGMVGLN